MEVGKIGYNTCKMVYNKLGTENGRTALKILKSFGEQNISPRISRVKGDTLELQFYNQCPDDFGNRTLITQVYDFTKRVFSQYSAADCPNIDGLFHKNGNLKFKSFSEIGLQ